MVDSLTIESNRISVVRNDKIAFDTSRKSIHLFPQNRLSLSGINITFPNLVSTIYYNQAGQVGGASFCQTYSALLPQEHGPGFGDFSPTDVQYLNNRQPIRRELPQTYIGSVPSGTTYIDVRARITRTVSPPTFMRYITPPLVLFPEGEWINLPGGSCICEYFFPLSRMFNVVRLGNDLYIQRFQSVYANPNQTITTTGGDQNGVTSSRQGTQWGNYAEAPIYWAEPAVFFDTKGLDGVGNKRPPWGNTSSNSCSTGSIVDYTSQYTAEFIITPGRYA